MIYVNKGDLVDFGAYGELYVCNPELSKDYYWVTDEEFNRDNEFADGWSILKDLAKKVVEEYEEEEFDFSDYDLEDEFNNLIANSEDFEEDLETNDIDDNNRNEEDKEDIMLNEAVSYEFFKNYSDILDKYLPDSGEGNTMATQAVTALNKLVYKWYNDGDVFDNTHYMEGWMNDLSSYANWLYNNIPETHSILLNISNVYNDSDYEDLLADLAEVVCSDEVLNGLNEKDIEGSIYDAKGPFEFVEYDEEDDFFSDNYDEDDYDEDDYGFEDIEESYANLYEEDTQFEENDYEKLADKIIDLAMDLDFFDYYNSKLDGVDDIASQLTSKEGREQLKYWLEDSLKDSNNQAEIKDILSDMEKLSNIEEKLVKESKINKSNLESDLKTEVFNVMTSEEFGFEPDEVKDYSVLEISEDAEKIKVEVRAELSYDGLLELSEKLDKIIAKYDKDAYFDMDEPGIMSAYLWK